MIHLLDDIGLEEVFQNIKTYVDRKTPTMGVFTIGRFSVFNLRECVEQEKNFKGATLSGIIREAINNLILIGYDGSDDEKIPVAISKYGDGYLFNIIVSQAECYEITITQQDILNDVIPWTSIRKYSLSEGGADNDFQPKLVSGTNIKTINGESVLGSGTITVQPSLVSGTNIKTINNVSLLGSGNIYIQTPLYKNTLGGGDTYSLAWQNYYYFPTAISSDTIFSLPRPILMDGDPTGNDRTDYLNEILIEFPYTSGSISFTQTGATIKWQNGTTPTFTAGNSYQISIVNNLACFAEFKTT